MKPGRFTSLLWVGVCVVLSGRFESRSVGADAPTPAAVIPDAAVRKVEFATDIKPMFEAACIKCHAHGQKKGGFAVDSRELILKGGESGVGAVPGKGADSLIVKLVAGLDPDRKMPAKGPGLSAAQVGLLRAWIDQELPWPDGVKLGRGARAQLEPRIVTLPPSRAGQTNPVDRLLANYYKTTGFRPGKPVEDRVFARRAYLDITGLLPAPEEIAAFQRDRRSGKRSRLVTRLLDDNHRYAEHWLTFWNDALRNDYRGTGYIDGGRRQITPWLYGALATNMPFDRFVARLVNPDEHSEGFTKGIVWRGVVNASQTPPIQAAQSISQVFLGINLKCASCHDSFTSDWKLNDAYGLASIYADEPLEMVRCDKPLGEVATRKFLYPELGSLNASTNRMERLQSLAGLVTNPKNGRLTRTIVNRIWAKLMGRGLIEPVDEMDNAPWNSDLLDWLAWDLAEHGYDLKRTMRLILTSQAYQLPSVGFPEQAPDVFVFRGPLVKRLSAEQYEDALSSVTGLWRKIPANTEINFDLGKPGPLEPGPTPRWVWASEGADKAVIPQTIYLRRTFDLPAIPERALVLATADNRFTLYVNGKEAGSGDNWENIRLIDIRGHLRVGGNVLAVAAVNDAPSDKDKSPNPAGFLLKACIRGAASKAGGRGPSWDLVSDAGWLCTTNKVEGWQKAEFSPESWRPAAELGLPEMGPWGIAPKLATAWSVTREYGRVRAALAVCDPLMTALGRPNREQVLTSRSPIATTMQALELTNGATLADWLRRGAEQLLSGAGPNVDGGKLVELVFRYGLSRPPGPEERKAAEGLVGVKPSPEGVQDLLWSLSMLPEFQLIY